MKLRDLQLGDILVIDGVAYERLDWFTGEDSEGNGYYLLHSDSEIKRFYDGHILLDHFQDNIYLIKQ